MKDIHLYHITIDMAKIFEEFILKLFLCQIIGFAQASCKQW